MERHHHSGHVGIGFIQGYGLNKGALATSVAHDSHNLIAVGTNEIDMAVAAEWVKALQGGYVLACEGRVVAELALPIAGLMSPEPAEASGRSVKLPR